MDYTENESKEQWMKPNHGWIKLKLCDISTPELNLGNFFHIEILTNSRVWKIKEIVKQHYGNIENITLYDKDPDTYNRRKAMKDRMIAEKWGGEGGEQEKEYDMWAEEEDEETKIDPKIIEAEIKRLKEKGIVYNEAIGSQGK